GPERPEHSDEGLLGDFGRIVRVAGDLPGEIHDGSLILPDQLPVRALIARQAPLHQVSFIASHVYGRLSTKPSCTLRRCHRRSFAGSATPGLRGPREGGPEALGGHARRALPRASRLFP